VRKELEISWIARHRENILGFWAKKNYPSYLGGIEKNL
jgi:hypothetical protein